jgi:hypothetical protein
MALLEISSVTGVGLEELKRQTWALLESIGRSSDLVNGRAGE